LGIEMLSQDRTHYPIAGGRDAETTTAPC
jgi:hypothetical protein